MEGRDDYAGSQRRSTEGNSRGRWFPETSFLEDYRRNSQRSPQSRNAPSLHSRPLAHYYNLPNSLESSYNTTTTAKEEEGYGYDESSFFDANLMLNPPYRTHDAPPRFGVTQEHYRRRYTPFPRLETPPQQGPSPRRRRMSTDSLFDTSANTSQSRPNNAFVDLTNDSPVMRPSERLAQANYNLSDGEPPDAPSAKRRKTQDVKEEIEEVDLRDVDDDTDLARVLEQQRAATVRAQQAEADKPTKLANVTCVVCMDGITNATATHCGHLFCHTCLMEALIVGENQGSEPGKGTSKCPICRKKIKRPKDNRDTGQAFTLEIMKGFREAAGKGKERADAQHDS